MESGDEIEEITETPELLMHNAFDVASEKTDNGKKLMSAFELAYVKYPKEESPVEPENAQADETKISAVSPPAEDAQKKKHTRHENRMARGIKRAQERSRNRELAEERNKSERDKIWARIIGYDYQTLTVEYEKYYRGKGQGYYYESPEARRKKTKLRILYGAPCAISFIAAIACGILLLFAIFMDLIGKNVPFFIYYFPFLAGCLVMSYCCYILSAKIDDLERDVIDSGYEITVVGAGTIFGMLDQRFKKDFPSEYDRFIKWIRQQLILEEQAYIQRQQLAEQRLVNENLIQINRDLNEQVSELNKGMERIRNKLPWWW